jgi:hypothetical protein
LQSIPSTVTMPGLFNFFYVLERHFTYLRALLFYFRQLFRGNHARHRNIGSIFPELTISLTNYK